MNNKVKAYISLTRTIRKLFVQFLLLNNFARAVSRCANKYLILPLVLVQLVTLIGFPSSALAGSDSCNSAPQVNLEQNIGGYVNKDTHPDDWYKIYIPSSGTITVGIYNNNLSSTNLIFLLFKDGCTAGNLVGSWNVPKGIVSWIRNEPVTSGYYYLVC